MLDLGIKRGQAFLDAHNAKRGGLPEEFQGAGKVIVTAKGKSAPQSLPALRETVEIVAGDSIHPEPIRWLWDSWLAEGKLHILGGQAGSGKTTLALALAATLSSGGRWTDGTKAEPGNVLIWSGEDDPKDVLVPRLLASGADMSRIHFVGRTLGKDGVRPFDPGTDFELLSEKLKELGTVRLLIVDPVVSAILGDSHKNAETRRGLQPLVDLAGEIRCAVLGITHFSKGTQGREPLDRITGSLAFGAVARIVFVAAKQKDVPGNEGAAKRIFMRAKSNIGVDTGGFEFDLRQSELREYPGIFASYCLWGGSIEGTAREILAEAEAMNDGEGGGESLIEAKEFILDVLSEGQVPVKDIRSDSEGAGYSWATIRRAKESLGIEAVKEGGHFGEGRQQWLWKLPSEEGKSLKVLKNTEGAQQNKVSIFSKIEHLQQNSILNTEGAHDEHLQQNLGGLRENSILELLEGERIKYLPDGQIEVTL